jgi:penicillin-binding protein 2
MQTRFVAIGWFVLIAAGCSAATAEPLPLPTPRLALSTPQPSDFEPTAAAFLAAWERRDYAGQYSLLSPLSQAAISLEAFSQRYDGVATAMTQTGLETRILSSLGQGQNAQVSYAVTFRTAVFGAIQSPEPIVMPLVFSDGRWGVSWSDGLILPQLAGGNYLAADYTWPGRANIYDRNGHGLAVETEAVALGVIPGQITDEAALLDALSNLLDVRADYLQGLYFGAQPDWYIPLGEASAEAVQSRLSSLSSLGGLQMTTMATRYYPDGGVASHVLGYTAFIAEDQLDEYRQRGYRGDERVGGAGIERWGEASLAGRPRAEVNVFSPTSAFVASLAQSRAQASQAITLTIDRDLQQAVQAALGDLSGAIVVLQPSTGEVLAMASSPAYDPNVFDPANPNSVALPGLLSDARRPLLNRAAQGLYPPGSVFKIVTMAAAIDSGIYHPEARYNCPAYWTELGPGYVKEDWTVKAGLPPHGEIGLQQALTVSCNPYFWHIGLSLYNADPNFLAAEARAYGLGPATGIEQIAEADGVIPDPAWKEATWQQPWSAGDSVNMATGQGDVLVTPLQVARMIAAVANGGTLLRPQLVQSVASPGSPPSHAFQPEVVGRLPTSPEHLAAIQEALRNVTRRTVNGVYTGGTAWEVFRGLAIPVAGKTGTAEDPGSPLGLPHAWFAGYTRMNDPGRPDIAAAVVVENIGEGSEYAAPIFRRIVEVYFFGRPYTLYPWEASFGVTAVPSETPEPFEIPAEGTAPSP